MKKTTRQIKSACKLPSYGDLMFCINELLENKGNKNDISLILHRASVLCPDYTTRPTRYQVEKSPVAYVY